MAEPVPAGLRRLGRNLRLYKLRIPPADRLNQAPPTVPILQQRLLGDRHRRRLSPRSLSGPFQLTHYLLTSPAARNWLSGQESGRLSTRVVHDLLEPRKRSPGEDVPVLVELEVAVPRLSPTRW
jgi:hypothetical protein